MVEENQFDKDIELQKIQSISDYFQTKLNLYFSIVAGVVVAALVAISTAYLTGQMNIFHLNSFFYLLQFILIILIFAFFSNMYVKPLFRYQDDALELANNLYIDVGQRTELPTLLELKKRVRYRVVDVNIEE
jgi:hypothetical protein